MHVGRRTAIVGVLLGAAAYAVVIDRIAVIAGNSIIKDSDIERNIRVTSFLNDERPSFSVASRKTAANRLLDQIFIRREIQDGDYPVANLEQAEEQLAALKRNRYRTDGSYERAVEADGITDVDLRIEFQWQLTVLRFIDIRFKPAVLVSDEDVQKYYRAHVEALRRAHPGDASFEDVKAEIQNTLTGERVNQQFFSWLDEQRKNEKIRYLEEGLQ